tara:strand:- start:1538 stop:1792 length:255 start_codon:yes stop_codon:yes gene_type:complete
MTKQTNKFMEIGQIVTHNTTGSRWIVVETNPYTGHRTKEGYKRLITAYCLYSGNQPDYWQPGQLDDWVLNDKDLSEYDKIWTIV